MQPLITAAILLLLSSGLAWAGDTPRLAFSTPRAPTAPSGELRMIQLQSTVAQRQLAIQITTQMLSKMNQAQSTVARNIR